MRETDLFGRFYFRVPGKGRFEGYYETFSAVEPLVRSEEWQDSVTGFYINASGDSDTVRLSFFTADPVRVQGVVERFLKRSGLKHFRPPEPPRRATVSGRYGGEELRFRRFLTAYTLIGLDIMKKDLLHARRLFVTFRWQVSIARVPCTRHFLKTFESLSGFYNSLSPRDQKQFWDDLAHWPKGAEVNWAHMFVNMVLGGDWIGREWTERYEAAKPLSVSEINEMLERAKMGFQVPEDWRP